ncbi:MAG TPA: glycosyltransferase family 39 protein [Terriglobales bacterium]|nr:glycosyltransferase family 39 protein [Terriglobales bacterium]
MQPRPYLLMVLLALAIRLALVPFTLPDRLNPDKDHWRFAGETGRIARSLVQGRGFSSPLHADTGPTAWMTPLYPMIVAAVFKLFGIYTKASAIDMLFLDCLFSALTCIPVFFIAKKSFGERAARWSGWGWAFFPYAIFFSADFIWATTLTTLALACLFLFVLHLESASVARWMGFGIAAGLAALVDPVVLSVIPFCALWMAFRLYRHRQPWLVPSLAAILAFAAVVSPWFIRNYNVFHTFIPFRDNAGLELYVGNNGDNWHFAPTGHHPSDTDREWQEYRQMGELPYMRHKKQQAFDYISHHKAEFVGQSLRRALYMWTNFWSISERYRQAEPLDPPNIVLCTSLTVLALTGLRRAFRRGLHATPYAIALFFFPIVYYFTHGEDYYRRPIDPIFLVLAVYALTGFFSYGEQRAPS